jgi:hypothetical protein
MNIARTASETIEVKAITTTIYINMELTTLAADINNGDLVHQFNGTGRKVVLLPEQKEAIYLNYSSDKAGQEIVKPPFEINNGDNIKFKLQTVSDESSNKSDASVKWKGIIQNRYNLRLIAGKKSTYKAFLAEESSVEETPTDESDEVNINIHFKLNGNKFSVAWAPKVSIVKA